MAQGPVRAVHWARSGSFLSWPRKYQARAAASRASGSPIINNSIKTPTYNQHKYIAVDHRGFGLALAAAGWVSLAPSGQRGACSACDPLGGATLLRLAGLGDCIVDIMVIRVFIIASFCLPRRPHGPYRQLLRLHRLRRDLGWLQRSFVVCLGPCLSGRGQASSGCEPVQKKFGRAFPFSRRLRRNRATSPDGKSACPCGAPDPQWIFSILAEKISGSCGGFAGLGVTHH